MMEATIQRRQSLSDNPGGRRRRGDSFRSVGRRAHVKGGAASTSVSSSDRKKFEEEVSRLTDLIKEKEKQHSTRVITDNTDISERMSSLDAHIKEEDGQRNQLISNAKSMEEQLRQLGTQVSKKREEANRLIVGLRFKSQESYDAQIERVEQQLQGGQFSVNDERRFVTEIENLRVSKTRLSDYLAIKGEIDKLRNDQDDLRKKRDVSYQKAKEHREICSSLKDQQKELKAKWEGRKDKQRYLKAQQESLEKEILELYQERGRVRKEFKQLEAHYSELQRETLAQETAREKEEQRKKEEERKMMREAKRKMRDLELDQQQELALDEERQTCCALMSYLTRMQTSIGGTTPPIGEGSPASSTSVSPEDSLTHTRDGSGTPQPGRYLVSTRPNVEWVPTGGRRRSKREKERKKSVKLQQKRLNINAATFAQFSLLGIHPPVTPSDISTTLAELQQKLCCIESRRSKASSEAGDSGIMLSAGVSETSEVYCSEDLASGEVTPNHKPSKGEQSVSPLPLPQCTSESTPARDALPNGHLVTNY